MNIVRVAKQSMFLFCLAGIWIALFPGKTTRVALETVTLAIVGIFFINYSNCFKTVLLHRKGYLEAFFFATLGGFVYGCFVAGNYEQWRFLITAYAPLLLLPWIAILAANPNVFQVFIKLMLTMALPLSFVYFLSGQLNSGENLPYINYVSSVYILVLLIPYVKTKWRVIIILVSVMSLILNLLNRTNAVCIIISYLSLFSIYLVKYTSNTIFVPLLKAFRIFLFVIPVVFSILGYSETLNIFEYMEEKEAAKMSVTDEVNLATDSRTGIYQDAVKSIHTPYDLVFGISPVIYYETSLSDAYSRDGEFDKGRLGGSEAAILNFLQYGGVIFIGIVFLLFSATSYISIVKSNSTFLKLLSLSISLRWLFLFIEHPLLCNFTWISLFMVFGVVLSPKFLRMTDEDIKQYFSTI